MDVQFLYMCFRGHDCNCGGAVYTLDEIVQFIRSNFPEHDVCVMPDSLGTM